MLFGRPLAHFWWPLGYFWLCFGILGSQNLRVVPPSWRPRAAPKTLQKRNLDFSSIWGAVLVIFSRFLSILNKFRTPFRRYFHDFSSQNLPYQNGPNSHPQRSLDFFIAIPANVNQFQVQKSRFDSQDLKVSAVAPNYNQQKYHKRSQPRKRSKREVKCTKFWGQF